LSGSGNPQSFPDSTANANTATVVGSASETPGDIGNCVALSGSPNYIDAGNNPSVLPTHTGTFSVWVNYNAFDKWTNPMGNGSGASDRNGVLFWNYPGGQLDFEVDGPNGLDRVAGNTLVTGRWYYLTGTWDGSTVSLYENGALVASTAQTLDASPAYDLTLGVDGALSYSGDYLNGSLDEARVSGIARSADWVATEYANQSSPSTFFALSSEATTGIAPAAVALYVNQSQQFAAPGLCSAGVTWSLSSDTEGTLTPSGLYTSPTSITVQQTVTVTATSQANSGQSASATVTLLPAVSVTVSPASITLNQNQSQQFTATVNNSLSQAVTWTMSPAVIHHHAADRHRYGHQPDRFDQIRFGHDHACAQHLRLCGIWLSARDCH
jgi:hypothetical protein